MVANQSLIAYTVMVQRTDGKWMFLVQNEKSDFIFPGLKTESDTNQTGLSSVIEVMKTGLDINFDKLELLELTNAVTKEDRVPLFVFKYHCGAERLEDLLIENSVFEWQVSDNFKSIIEKYEISGVPLF